jgi:diaminohydroxyphosphoribosylaminopyrimidine deaminase/5-amino-6-(5-phosphoribosylamino)uracil reductase
MKRAMELARNGLGYVSPNPMVGCVIVRDDQIIGEGWHQKYGGPHAEVNAINQVEDKSLIKGSEVYVNLEPCAHHGKTPPCAELLVSYQVKHVILSNRDINPLVHGKGIQILKSAGIRVTEGVLAAEGNELNRRFFTFHAKERPYGILKWAETADGYMARPNHDSKWISNEYSRQMVHKWRTEEDGIMVGANTVLYDDPALNVRDWVGKDPIRIIIDPHLKTMGGYQIYNQKQKTLIYNFLEDQEDENTIFIRLNQDSFLSLVLKDLKYKGIQSVLIEGGKYLLEGFLKEGLWDEARIFTSPMTIGKGLEAPQMIEGELLEKQAIFDDQLFIYKNRIS